MIRSIFYPTPAAHEPQHDLSPQNMEQALTVPEALLWVSLENPEPADYSILRDVFHFHPLAIEDCQADNYQPPKIDDYGKYIFMIVHTLHVKHELENLETHELNLFLGENYLVTVFHGDLARPIDSVFNRLKRDERLSSFGSDFLCHAVLDALVDEYIPFIDQMDEEIEILEDQVLSNPNPQTLERILHLKHSIMALRRIISPMREVMNRLSRDEFPMIDQQSRIYFRDIYDHLVRIQDLSESIRDIVSGAMDIYLNSTSLRLNEVMKALTIVSTIFLPLSFLAGVYGTNFTSVFPQYQWEHGFLLFWLVCLLIAGSMLAWFKRRGWF